MGHGLSDAQGVDAIARNVVELIQSGVLAGEVQLVRELPQLGVSAESFRAEIRLQGDRLAWESPDQRTMVAVRFFSPTATSDEPWTIYVRVDWLARRDRLAEEGPLSAKAFRRRMAPKRHRSESSRRAADWSRSEDIWVSPNGDPDGTLDKDLRAQIALFLTQVDLLEEPGASAVAEQLVEYLRRDLRLTEDVAAGVMVRVLKGYWWPTGWRSWRAYLAKSAWGARSDQIESRSRPLQLDATLLTIDAVSELTSVPRRTLYQRAKQGLLVTERDPKGRILVPRAEALRLGQALTPRAVVEKLVHERGLTRAAARKRVQRHKGALADLLDSSSKHKR